MPVEIRELVIQAQVRENTDLKATSEAQPETTKAAPAKDDCAEDGNVNTEKEDRLIEQVIARMQEWLIEKSMR